jgi:hypothetical protein
MATYLCGAWMSAPTSAAAQLLAGYYSARAFPFFAQVRYHLP